MSELRANSEKPEDRLARLRFNAIPDSEEPAPERAPGQGMPPDERRCCGITKTGERCTAWAMKDSDKCSGHAGINLQAAHAASRARAEARAEARQSIRERAARALNDDWPDVLAALRRGIKQPDDSKAAAVARDYVRMVFGSQLQRPEDERPSGDPLDVATMTRAERDELKRKLIADHPELAERFRLAGVPVAETGDTATQSA